MDTLAWVLNFDAENELSLGPGYTPSAAMRARTRALRQQVHALVGTCLFVDDDTPPGAAAGLRGAAWCPTPRALALLRRAGASVPDAPSFDVLREVNHRRFATTLGPTLPGAVFTADAGEIARAVGGTSPTSRWLLKRPLAMAGRGRLRVDRGELDERARRWIGASLRGGDGLQVEPWVERRGDVALHWMLARDGARVLGRPTRLVVDDAGAWVRSELASDGELSAHDHAILVATAHRAADALHASGYSGPFNLDAFHHADERGDTRFHPLCELNARYSMGFAVGFGGAAIGLPDSR